MILLTGILIAVFVVPDAWTVPTLIGFALVEAAETVFTWRWSRRGRPKVGVETLIGAAGRATSDCDPDGRVRVRGEPWQARAAAPVRSGEAVRVIGRDRLTLLVEPLAEPAPTAAETPPGASVRGRTPGAGRRPSARE